MSSRPHANRHVLPPFRAIGALHRANEARFQNEAVGAPVIGPSARLINVGPKRTFDGAPKPPPKPPLATALKEILKAHGLKDTEGVGPLRTAVIAGNLPCVRALLDAGADVHQRNALDPILVGYDTTRLMNEAPGPSVVVCMAELMDRGADVNAAMDDARGNEPYVRTLLHVAASEYAPHSSAAFAEFLLQRGANHKALDSDGSTPLEIAATFNVDAVPVLLRHGANVNARDKKGNTVLKQMLTVYHWDRCYDLPDQLPVLIQYGALRTDNALSDEDDALRRYAASDMKALLETPRANAATAAGTLQRALAVSAFVESPTQKYEWPEFYTAVFQESAAHWPALWTALETEWATAPLTKGDVRARNLWTWVFAPLAARAPEATVDRAQREGLAALCVEAFVQFRPQNPALARQTLEVAGHLVFLLPDPTGESAAWKKEHLLWLWGLDRTNEALRRHLTTAMGGGVQLPPTFTTLEAHLLARPIGLRMPRR